MNRSIAWVISALCLAPATAFGAGWSTVDQSVRAMGTGGAGTANADDPGANYYNAAAGMMSPGLAASLGVVIAAPALSAAGDGIDARTGGTSIPPHVHARFTGEHFGFGASVTVPFGSDVQWPSDWAGRFDLRSAAVRVIRTSGFLSARFKMVSVAAGPHFDAATLKLDRAIDFIDTEGVASIETKATGLGVSAAVFVRPLESLDVGLSYQSRTKLLFDGFADFTTPPEFSGRAEDGAIRTQVTLPDRIRLGGRYRIDDAWAVLADLELTLWGTIDQLVLDFESEANNDIVQRRDWRTTVTPRAGVVWSVLPFLDVRGGVYFDPSPVPAATVGPSSPDSDRVGLTLGAGLAIIDNVGVDLGYQLVVFTGADGMSETMPTIRYSGTVHLLGAAITARL